MLLNWIALLNPIDDAAEIVNLCVPGAIKKLRGLVAAVAAATIKNDRFVLWHLTQSAGKLVDRDVDGAWNVTAGKFLRRAHIEQHMINVGAKLRLIVGRRNLCVDFGLRYGDSGWL